MMNKDIKNIISISKGSLSLLLVVALLFLFNVGFFAVEKINASSTVTVSATVTQTVTCNTNVTSTSFGALSSASVNTASPNATTTVATNDPLGLTLLINDSNHGLATTSPAYTIPSVSATLAAGTEGYGIQATSSAGITVSATYDKTGNAVGALTTSTQTLASSSATVSSATVTVAHLAAISASTPAGSYSDSITYSCNGN